MEDSKRVGKGLWASKAAIRYTNTVERSAFHIWVFIAEIFPNQHRVAGQSLGSGTHWVFAALLTFLFSKMVTAFPPGYVFLFFCGMMVLQLLWVRAMVPETKGVPLEEIEKQLAIDHA